MPSGHKNSTCEICGEVFTQVARRKETMCPPCREANPLTEKPCSKCGVVYPVSRFSKNKRAGDGLKSRCKDCCNEINGKYNKENPEKIREHQAKWRIKNREEEKERVKKWRKDNPERIKETRRNHRLSRKVEAFNILGGVLCISCKYDDIRALSIDHIYNDGWKDREQGLKGTTLYNHIIAIGKEEARKKYQVLCRNCNRVKANKLMKVNRKTPNKLSPHERLKLKAFNILTDDNIVCNYPDCSYTNMMGLELDHVYNNGYKERKKNKFNRDLFRKIISMDEAGKRGEVKEEYQILCSTCNWIKRIENMK